MDICFYEYGIINIREMYEQMNVQSQEINHVLDLLKEIKYGSVSIIVHDGKITQVDSTKKVRFTTKDNVMDNRY
jgi:hypothetical protein